MADANESVVINTEASEDAQQEQLNQVSNSAENEEVANDSRNSEFSEEEFNKIKEILEKSRKAEKYAKQQKQQLEQRVAELEAQGDWKAKYEQAEAKLAEKEEKINRAAVDVALAEAAKEAKAKDTKAFIEKLVDRAAIKAIDGVVDAESVEAAVLKAKEEYPTQFEVVDLPSPRRAAEGAVTGGFEKELEAAKTQEEVLAVLSKYKRSR